MKARMPRKLKKLEINRRRLPDDVIARLDHWWEKNAPGLFPKNPCGSIPQKP